MELVWAAGVREATRTQLLARAPSESGGALLCRASQRDGNDLSFFAIEFEPAQEQELEESWEAGLTIDPGFWVRLAKPARRRGLSIVPIHTHPGCQQPPTFSRRDLAGEVVLQPVLERLTSRPAAAVVMGDRYERIGRFADSGTRREGSARPVGMGPRKPTREATVDDMFSRHVAAFGQEGQRRLATLTVAVAGASGTGSHVCEQLIRLGVGRLIVIDHDVVERVNINRIVTAFGEDARAARNKVDVVAQYAADVGTGCVVEAVNHNVLVEGGYEHLVKADALFGCTDTLASRAVLNRCAIQNFVPYWDCGTEISSGAGLRVYGRMRVVLPGGPCLYCMGTIDPEELRVELLDPAQRDFELARGYIRGDHGVAPSVVTLNAVVASLATTHFLRWAVGDEPVDGGEWVYRSYVGDVRVHRPSRQPDCPVCSIDARLGRSDLPLAL